MYAVWIAYASINMSMVDLRTVNGSISVPGHDLWPMTVPTKICSTFPVSLLPVNLTVPVTENCDVFLWDCLHSLDL